MAILEVRGLVKYYGSRKVVDGVTFQVDVGEVVGLLGPNGAGKTTSFRMTTGQVTPNGGKVIFAGKDVTHLPMFGRARLGMGYLAQETSVFRKLTVEQNVMAILEIMPKHRVLGRKLTRAECLDRTEKVLDKFGLTHLRKNNAARLSGGEKRRLEIARCLACDPLLILLDEPFTGIDPQTIEDIQHIVLDLKKQGIGILVTDHRVREILSITDRSYLIKGGTVRTHGAPQDLIRDPIAIQEYLGNSFNNDSIGLPTTVIPSRETMGLRPPSTPLVQEKPVDQTQGVQKLIEREKVLELLVQFASGSDRAGEELQRYGISAVPFLLDALERRDSELRRRVHGLLEQIARGPIPFDPFAPEAQRRQQLSGLRDSLLSWQAKMTIEFKNLISQYIHGGYLLRQAVAYMPLEHLLARPIEGKWSTLEVVCHIADFEPVFADRMKRVIALENPQLLGADENLFLKSLSYHQRNISEELALIDLVRSQMARILAGLPDSAWGRVGIHSEKGPVSLHNLLEKAIGHVTHHLSLLNKKEVFGIELAVNKRVE